MRAEQSKGSTARATKTAIWVWVFAVVGALLLVSQLAGMYRRVQEEQACEHIAGVLVEDASGHRNCVRLSSVKEDKD